MKKIILTLVLCLSFVLCGCKNSELNLKKESKNLNTYTMDLTYNQDHTLVGSQTLNYTNRSEANLKYLSFHLYVKAFSKGAVNKPVSTLNESKAYPNGLNYGDIQINSAMVSGKTTEFDYAGVDNNILNVSLLSELEPFDSVKLELNYKVYVPNVNHRFGYGDNAINMANFYPIVAVIENGEFVCDPYNSNGDPFYSDVANYNVKLTVPNKYTVASTGTHINVSNDANTKTYNINALCVRDFAFVMSDKFSVVSSEVDGVNVNYYYYSDSQFESNLKASADAVKTFNNLFGKYPYQTLSVVQTNFVHGGMEYPNLVYISDEVEGADYTNVIIHEIAHQWWYGVVGSNAFKYPWLDEGLTEYSTLMFYQENPDYGINTNELIKNTNNSYVTFVDLYTEVLGKLDTSMNRALNEYGTEPEYVYATYVRGMLFFDNLCEVIGRNVFIDGLKEYYKTYALKNTNPDCFIAIMEKVSNKELKNYINSWLDGKVVIIPIGQ